MSGRFLLLLHQIPPKPAYLRAKVLRRLSQVGALAIKNSAYLLPESDDTLEDFEWLRGEIEQQGGAAWLFLVETIAGMSREEIEDGFRQLHSSEFETLLEQGRAMLVDAAAAADETFSAYRKLAKRSQELARIDFFENPQRFKLEQLVGEIDRRLHAAKLDKTPLPAEKRGGVWVTRKGVRVDRIASAWLIRRFVDPEATFRFINPANYAHQPEEIRFDMFEGEFTHRGEACTFEVLVSVNGLESDPALVAIAEIVHDIDLKDDRYKREETAGVSRLLDGLCAQVSDDGLRLERGGLIFESLYKSFG